MGRRPRLHDDRASFDFAQDEDHHTWHLPMEVRTTFILSEVEGRTAPIQVACQLQAVNRAPEERRGPILWRSA
jgi:hypothetical protein